MATKTYSEKLRDPRWQKKRLKILERDNWKCTNCGADDKCLHVHHLKYTGNPWDASDKDLQTLCEVCHKEETLADKNRKEDERVKAIEWAIIDYAAMIAKEGRISSSICLIEAPYCIEKESVLIGGITRLKKELLKLERLKVEEFLKQKGFKVSLSVS